MLVEKQARGLPSKKSYSEKKIKLELEKYYSKKRKIILREKKWKKKR